MCVCVPVHLVTACAVHGADGRVNVMYSTPATYVDAVYATNWTWTVKTDDFFPCAAVLCHALHSALRITAGRCLLLRAVQTPTTTMRIGRAISRLAPL